MPFLLFIITDISFHPNLVLNLQSLEILSNATLPEFGLPKSDSRQTSWLKFKVKDEFIIIFNFILPFFQACSFTRWVNNKLGSATLLKKRLWHRCFPVNFAKFLRTPFLQNTSGRLLLQNTHQIKRYTSPHLLKGSVP